MRSHLGVILVSLCTVMFASIAAAQQAPSLAGLDEETIRRIAGGEDPASFGTRYQFSSMSTFAWQSRSSDYDLDYYGEGFRYTDNSPGLSYYFTVDIGVGVDVPVGAEVAALCATVYDGASDGEVKLAFVRYEQPVDSSGTPSSERFGDWIDSGIAWDDGYTQLCVTPMHQMTTYDDINGDGTFGVINYAVHVIIAQGSDPEALRIGGVFIWWARQISPAPATATFDDVPVGAFGFQHVEALAASGITAGCDASNFCPNQPLTRVQMAVFLAKALGLHFTQ